MPDDTLFDGKKNLIGPSIPDKTPQQPSEPVGIEQQPRPEGNLTFGQRNVTPHPHPSPISAQPSSNETGDNTPQWKKRLEYVAAVVGIGLLIINIFQLRSSQKAAEAARSAAEIAKSASESSTQQIWKAIDNLNWTARSMDYSAHASQDAAKTASDQVRAMQEQLAVTDRPWVTVDVSACLVCGEGDLRGGPIVFDDAGNGRLTYTVTYKNVGKSIANKVRIRAKARAMAGRDIFESPVKEQTALCAGPPKTSAIDFGRSIIPGEPQSEVIGPTSFETKQIPGEPMIPNPNMGKPIALFLIGCVDYEYATSPVHHQSGFLYWINQVNPKQVIQTLETIPVSRILFVRYELGGWYAY